jgi:ribonuclease Y
MVILIAVIFTVIGFGIGWVINSKIGKNSIAAAEEKGKKILEDAEKEANNLKREKLLEVKEEWHRKKQ